jgi:hypothetical protein
MPSFVTLESFGFEWTPLRLRLCLGIVLTYCLYRLLLPRPIPGIPYNAKAAQSILGDLPGLIKFESETKEVLRFLKEQVIKHQAPVVQVFVHPLGKPSVILSDYREGQDILLHRSTEFDRSNTFATLFEPVLPDFHLSRKTDEEFGKHRRLIQSLMTPTFLHEVAAPQIYAAGLDLIGLWKEKKRLACGHPFSAWEDGKRAALDAIWAFSFGTDSTVGESKVNLDLLSRMETIDKSDCLDDPVAFPNAKPNEHYTTMYTIVGLMDSAVQSPFPRISTWFLRKQSRIRKAYQQRDEMIAEELERAKEGFTSSVDQNHQIRCAREEIMSRELRAANKEGRNPEYHTKTIYDEVSRQLFSKTY